MSVPRMEHTATRLPDGKVLVVGGMIDTNFSVPSATAEVFDPATGVFSPTGNLGQARSTHQAILLANGKVLIVGGITGGNIMIASAELYDPATGMFTATGSMNIPRAGFSANLLPSGKVLVAGGYNNSNTWNAPAELYDPATGTFSLTGNLNVPRYGHEGTNLANGAVLISGGNSFGVYTGALEFYDPGTGVFVNAGSMIARAGHVAQLLPNGRVLLAGGARPCCPGGLTPAAQLWDPSTSTTTDISPMNIARSTAGAILLPNGTVLIAGGLYAGGPQGVVTNSAEIFNPATNQFSLESSTLGIARFVFTTTLMAGGRVLLTGGATANGPYAPTASAEVFSNRSLLVAVTAEDSLWQYDEHGAFLGRFVSPGPAPYQDSQIAMAFGPDHNLYKAGSGGSANVVRVFSGNNGAYIRDLFPPGMGGLVGANGGLHFGSDGMLYVSASWNTGKCSISRFDPQSGAYLGDLDADAACANSPGDMTVGPDGYLYAGWSGPNGVYVKRYNTTSGVSLGNFTAPGAAGGGGFVSGIALGDDGTLYVADFGGQAVHRFDSTTGAFVGNISTSWPSGLALGTHHDVYVSLRYSATIADYDRTTGAFLGTFASGITEPTRLAWMPPDATPPPPPPVDTTPPVVTVPSNVTVNGTSAAGATVTFAATATDPDDAAGPVSCSPAAGSVFSYGTTTVTCTSTDTHSNNGSASFTVTVLDVTPPVVTVPGSITVNATSPSGAAVTFAVSASDPDDAAGTVACSRASGSTFPIGVTTVTCTSTDTHSNTGSAAFTVTVRSPYTATVQPPINVDGSSVFSARRGVVPVKFTLQSNGTTTCQLPAATIAVFRTSGATSQQINESDYLMPSDSGSSFRIDASNCQYIFNLGSSSLGAGTYTVRIDVWGATAGSAAFALK